MAFGIRVEYRELPDASLGAIASVLVTPAVAPAVEIDAATVAPVALPNVANRSAYVALVIGLTGSALVTVGASANAGDYATDRGHLVEAGDEAAFLVQPDSFVFVTEYPEADE